MKPIKTKRIPFDEVQNALNSSSSLDTQRTFNTHEHTVEEVRAALPDHEHQIPDSTQPWLLLSTWLDIILQSQGVDPDCVHRIKLSGFYCDELVNAGTIWQLAGHLPSKALEELSECFPQRTTDGTPVTSLFSKGERYFMRLDTCSLKDAETIPSTSERGGRAIGTQPVTRVEELWQRILGSSRGLRGVSDLMDADKDVYLILLPWRDDVATEKGTEFRVFCPVPGDIAAISQYVWHRPLRIPDAIDDRNAWLGFVSSRIRELHKAISGHKVFLSMAETGFTFDVVAFTDKVELIEINTFGAMTGCGSCLFHWIKDARLLYGREPGIELRISDRQPR